MKVSTQVTRGVAAPPKKLNTFSRLDLANSGSLMQGFPPLDLKNCL